MTKEWHDELSLSKKQTTIGEILTDSEISHVQLMMVFCGPSYWLDKLQQNNILLYTRVTQAWYEIHPQRGGKL